MQYVVIRVLHNYFEIHPHCCMKSIAHYILLLDFQHGCGLTAGNESFQLLMDSGVD